jgi:hypothetical protein
MALDRLTSHERIYRSRRFNASYGETDRDLGVAYPAGQIATRDNRHELRRQC